MSRIGDEKCSKPKIFLAFLSKLLCFETQIIVKHCQFKYNYHRCCKIDAIFIQHYKQNFLNFRHHFVFGVPSKISSFYNYFTDKALNILFKFVFRLRNVSKNIIFECSHNRKWSVILTLVLSACYVTYK